MGEQPSRITWIVETPECLEPDPTSIRELIARIGRTIEKQDVYVKEQTHIVINKCGKGAWISLCRGNPTLSSSYTDCIFAKGSPTQRIMREIIYEISVSEETIGVVYCLSLYSLLLLVLAKLYGSKTIIHAFRKCPPLDLLEV